MSQYYCKLDSEAMQGKEVVFLNVARSTRSGFAHDSTLIVNGCRRGEYTAHYINRTWEWYRFQTAMLGAIDSALERELNRIRDNYKYENNLKRITNTHKEKLLDLYDQDQEVQTLRMIRDEVRSKYHYMY